MFTREDGHPIHPERLSKWFDKARDNARKADAELPVITLHGLRHSHATALLRAGVPIRVVSQRLGHASVNVTLGTYGHVLPGDDEAAAVTAASLLDGTSR